MTHLVFLTLGSRGDLQPLVALAAQYTMRYSQHRVSVVADDRYQQIFTPMYLKYGIDWYCIRQAISSTDRLEEGKQLWKICQAMNTKPTKLLYTTFVLEGYSIAEKLNIPSIVISFFPLKLYPIPGEFQQQLMTESPDLYESQLRRVWHPHIQHWMWRLFLNDQGDFREDILDLDPTPQQFDNIPIFIYALDPDLFQPDDDYDAKICGFWSLDKEAIMLQKQPVINDNHQRPVLIVNFGSMDHLSSSLIDGGDNKNFLKKILVRLNEIINSYPTIYIIWIMSGEQTDLYKSVIDSTIIDKTKITIYPTANIYHEYLIEKLNVIGIIHHGGMGTCSNMIKSGIPQAILPFMFDQYYWADKLNSLQLSKKLNINESWINTISWMMKEKGNELFKHWQKKVQDNTIHGLDEAIGLITNLHLKK